MQQVLLCLAAVLVISVVALTQQRSQLRDEQALIGREATRAASRLARERLTEVSSHAFDEADLTRDMIRFDATGLSVVPGPEPGETSEAEYDDVDDFNGASRDRQAIWNGGTIPFTELTTVQYVDQTDPSVPSATPTLAKRVVVRVVEVIPPGPNERPPVVAQLSAVVTPVHHGIHN